MEFKSIEFTGDHSIKTTYMAGDGNQDEYTVTCNDMPRPELRTTGLAEMRMYDTHEVYRLTEAGLSFMEKIIGAEIVYIEGR